MRFLKIQVMVKFPKFFGLRPILGRTLSVKTNWSIFGDHFRVKINYLFYLFNLNQSKKFHTFCFQKTSFRSLMVWSRFGGSLGPVQTRNVSDEFVLPTSVKFDHPTGWKTLRNIFKKLFCIKLRFFSNNTGVKFKC